MPFPHMTPDWDAPAHIRALTTLRSQDEVLADHYGNFNLATHVGDCETKVTENRSLLAGAIPSEPEWLTQTHSDIIISVDHNDSREGDASFTRKSKKVLAVMTADCLPVILTNKRGDFVAAIHAGWRGVANHIVKKTLSALNENAKDCLAWIGPGISQAHFEVQDDAKHLLENAVDHASLFFLQKDATHWCVNLSGIVAAQLKALGLNHIYESNRCTYRESQAFYSHRRDGVTGRMATLVWMD